MRAFSGWIHVGFGALLALAAALALLACGSAAGASTSTRAASHKKPVHIGVLLATEDGYEAAYLKGINKTIAKDGDTTITVLNSNFEANTQLQQCQDLITAGKVQELLIEPVDSSAIVPCVTAAKKAHIGAFSMDTPIGPNYASTKIQEPGITGQVIEPITLDAQAAVAMVVKACGNKNPCNVAAVVGEPAFVYSADKIKYEKQYLAKYPHIKLVATVVGGLSDPATGYSVAQNLITKDPNLNVILGDDDITLTGVARAVDGAGLKSKIALIGDAASTEGVQDIKDGVFFGSVIYVPETTAATATQMAIEAGRGEKIANNNVIVNTLVPLGTLELTKANVDKFTPQWSAAK